MSKSTGTLSRAGAGLANAAIVDVVQRRHADRLAKIAFIVVWFTLSPTLVVVLSTFTPLWFATIVGVLAGLAVAALVGLLVLIWPAVRLVWHWAGEITLLVLLLAAYLGLSRLIPSPAALGVLAVLVGAPVAIPPARRWLMRWVWCAISRHRLRTCFALFIRANRYGSLPWILLARPTRAGERVWVWLRPGLSLDDLQTAGGLARLAVGCWAGEVKLHHASRKHAALVRVDITRRNPLTQTVTSPLVDQVPALEDNTDPPTSGELDMSILDLPGVPEPSSTAPTSAANRSARPGRAPRKAPVPAQPAASAVVDDLSDWI